MRFRYKIVIFKDVYEYDVEYLFVNISVIAIIGVLLHWQKFIQLISLIAFFPLFPIFSALLFHTHSPLYSLNFFMAVAVLWLYYHGYCWHSSPALCQEDGFAGLCCVWEAVDELCKCVH